AARAKLAFIHFTVASSSASESGGPLSLPDALPSCSDVLVTVNYATSNGTATAGSDYTATSGTLSFGIGETQKTFTVAISNDTLVEGSETLGLTLSTPTGGPPLGTQSTATLTIQDDH